MRFSRLASLCALACGLAVVAQQFPEYSAGMKFANAAFGALEKLDPKTGPQAVRAAERLGGIYENMIAFWRQRNAADAVKWSEEGKAAAVELESAANAGETEKAAAAFQTLSSTCQSCHQAHREKVGEGKYRIK